MKYFGTDGIRGVAGIELSEELTFRCGFALSRLAKEGLIVLARDTRESGQWIAEAMAGGIALGGGSTIYGGVLPTPAVARSVVALGADFGAVVSASHNPPHYNGIKLFDRHGRKLNTLLEKKIESLMEDAPANCNAFTLYADTSIGDYYVNSILDKKADLSGVKIVLDSANGSASEYARRIFSLSGAEVISFNDKGDGSLINYRSGSLHPQFLQRKVLKYGADLGLAFDGDADRVIAVDDKGKIVDGDGILYALANYFQKSGMLSKNTVVATVMTNSAYEKAAKSAGINMVRVSVGDHNVCNEMQRSGYFLGGEQSGHIIISDIGTGDGIFAGILLAGLIKKEGKLSSIIDVAPLPQIFKNITVLDKSIPDLAKVNAECWNEFLGKCGRVLLRASGTEPVIRIMVECESVDLANLIAKDIELSLKVRDYEKLSKQQSNEKIS